MSQLLATLLPVVAFMLIPVWIPLIAAVGGMLVDLVSPSQDPLEQRQQQRAARNRQVALGQTD